MPTIPAEAKVFISERLARFDTPSEVAQAVNAVFGIEIRRQSIEAYDPTKRAGRSISVKNAAAFMATRAAFMAERKAFIADTASIGIASKVFRLRALQRMCDQAEAVGNFTFAADILAQAAREMGQDRG